MEPRSSVPIPIIGSRSKDVGWYSPYSPTLLLPTARELLERYSHVPPEEVDSHVQKIRDSAWEIFPWPCIGQFRFIDLSLSRSPSYRTVVARLKGGAKLLDLGCCVAQDLRKLVFDGVPASSLYGAELQQQFIDLGYELFLDRNKLGVTFMVTDLFNVSESAPLKKLEGRTDMIFVGHFLHLFDLPGQIQACKRLVELLKDEKGVLILGQQVGNTEAREVPSSKGTMFKHNVESFEELWKEIGESTGTRWEVRARLDTGLGISQEMRRWDEESTRRLSFEVERVD